jgi:hypothetical protein
MPLRLLHLIPLSFLIAKKALNISIITKMGLSYSDLGAFSQSESVILLEETRDFRL